MVKYTTDGITLGDSYLWFLNDNYILKSYQMNVSSMKMENIPATWEDLIRIESGTLLTTNHTFSSENKLNTTTIKEYN